jgi:hypothetical protein
MGQSLKMRIQRRKRASTEILVSLAVFWLLFSCAPIYCQDVDPELAIKVDRLAKALTNWNSLHSPGVAISLKETSRNKVKNVTAVTYRMFGTGFPKDKVYDILDTSLDLQPTTNLDGVTFDDSGQAVCAGRPDTCGDPKKPNDPIDLIMPAAKGEPKRISLVSEDGQVGASTYVVPFPIVGSDRLCFVEVILLLPDAEAVLVRASGLVPLSKIHVVGDSEGEKQEHDAQATGDGTFDNVQLPYVKGKSKGTMRITLQTESCSPSVSFTWGKNTYHFQ